MNEEDICGLCGLSGADKIRHPIHWPTEQIPNTEFVHASCEDEECRRAHQEFWNKVGKDGVDEFLRGCTR